MMCPTNTGFLVVLMTACAARVALAAGPPPVETRLPTRGSSAGTCVTFTPDGAVVYYDGRGIVTWDIAQRKTIATIPTKEWLFVLSPDGTRIANGFDASIRLYDAKSGQLLHELRPPPTDAKPGPGADLPFFRLIGFGERSKQFFTANPDDLQVWDVATGKMVGRIAHDGNPRNAELHPSPDGRWLTVMYDAGVTEILDTRTGRFSTIDTESVSRAMPRDGRRFTMLSFAQWSFSGDGRTVYAADQMNGLLAGWSVPEGKLRSHVQIPDLVFATVSRDASRILARYREPDDDILRVLDSKTRKVIATLGPFEDPVSWYAISPDNRYVAATSGDDPRIWDLSPGVDDRRPATRPARRTRE
jgi:WD40 repeat protein